MPSQEDIDEEVTSADVEISSLDYADDSEWANENLVESTRDRVVGGLSHEALLAREGELITPDAPEGDDDLPDPTVDAPGARQ